MVTLPDPAPPGKELFGEIAVRLGFITPDEVQQALKKQREEDRAGAKHKLIGIIMLELGLISTTQLVEVLQTIEKAAKASPTTRS